jgi:hypothetical protein
MFGIVQFSLSFVRGLISFYNQKDIIDASSLIHQLPGEKIKSQVVRVFFTHSNPSADIPLYGSTVRIFSAQAADEIKWPCMAVHEGGDYPDASATLITKISSSAIIRSTLRLRTLECEDCTILVGYPHVGGVFIATLVFFLRFFIYLNQSS